MTRNATGDKRPWQSACFAVLFSGIAAAVITAIGLVVFGDPEPGQPLLIAAVLIALTSMVMLLIAFSNHSGVAVAFALVFGVIGSLAALLGSINQSFQHWDWYGY